MIIYIIFIFLAIFIALVYMVVIIVNTFIACYCSERDDPEQEIEYIEQEIEIIIENNCLYTYVDKPDECTICLEKNTNIVLPCKHNFHEICILDWFTHNASCPLCRTEI